MPIVIVPEAYRGPTRGLSKVPVQGDTVRACLEAVEAGHPGFLDLVIAADRLPHKFVKLFVNEEQLGADALDTRLDDGDRLEILAAIAGG